MAYKSALGEAVERMRRRRNSTQKKGESKPTNRGRIRTKTPSKPPRRKPVKTPSSPPKRKPLRTPKKPVRKPGAVARAKQKAKSSGKTLYQEMKEAARKRRDQRD